MTAASVLNDYPVEITDFPHLAGYESLWETSLDKVQKAAKESETTACPDVEHESILKVDLATLFSPLRLFMADQQIKDLLTGQYSPSVVQDILSEVLTAKEFDDTPCSWSVGGPNPSSSEVAESTPTEAGLAALPRVSFAAIPLSWEEELERRINGAGQAQTNAPTHLNEAFGHLDVSRDFKAAFVELVSMIPEDRGALTVAAIRVATRLAADLPEEIQTNLTGNCRELWGVCLLRSRASARRAELTANDFRSFLFAMEKLIDADVFQSLLDRYHIAFSLDRFLGHFDVRSSDLAGLYMRLEGHGRLFHNNGTVYWQDGPTVRKICANDRPICATWRKFRQRVRDVIRGEFCCSQADPGQR